MTHLVTWLLMTVVVGALAAGAPALMWAGRIAGLAGWMPALVVVIVDGALIVMSMAAVVRRGRGERAGWMWAVVGALVLASASVQAVHAMTVTTATTAAGRVVAVAIGATPPVIVLIASHAWLDLAVAPAPTRARRAAVPARAPRVAPAARTVPSPAVASGSGVAGVPDATPTTRATTRPTGTGATDRVAALRAQAAPLREAGLSYQSIADRLGVSKGRVMRALGVATSENAPGTVGAAA